MRKIRPSTERPFALSTQYDSEFSGDVVAGVSLNFDGTVDGTATARQDATSRLLGTPEFVQAEESLIRANARDLRQLAAILAGGFPESLEPNPAGSPVLVATAARLPFGALLRGSLIDASRDKLFTRGTFGALTDYAASGATVVTGTIRPSVETIDVDASAGYWRPRIRQRTVDLSSADLDVQEVIRFEERTMLAGIMIRASDASADAGARVDGLIRGVRIDSVTGSMGQRELTRARWGVLRDDLRSRVGFGPEDVARSVGVVLVPFIDDGQASRSVDFAAGDSITIHLDTASTVEARYAAVTPASGDQAVITLLAFTRVAGRGPSGSPTVSPRVAPQRFGGRTRDVIRRLNG